MKIKTNLLLSAIFVFTLAVCAFAQQAAVQIPRDSQRAETVQTIGDARVSIVYHRPNSKGRPIFGEGEKFLVPYGKIWRTGANENTIFEVSENVRINGLELPAGKYGLHTIPGKDEWIVIFSRDNDKWGSFSYNEKQDALRVKVKPQIVQTPRETMMFAFDTVAPSATSVVIEWDKLRVPFAVDAGDVTTRVLTKLRKQITSVDQTNQQAVFGARMTTANFILDNKIKDAYAEAAKLIDESLKTRETFSTLRAKARISAEMGNYKDAITFGEKAVSVGKAANPSINAEMMANFEKTLAEWKTKR